VYISLTHTHTTESGDCESVREPFATCAAHLLWKLLADVAAGTADVAAAAAAAVAATYGSVGHLNSLMICALWLAVGVVVVAAATATASK